MTLRCKPGDLAVRVRAPKGVLIREGSIVRCVAQIGQAHLRNPTTRSTKVSEGVWIVEFRGSTTHPINGRPWGVADSDLRPIRDSDGIDETQCWELEKEPSVA